MIHIEDKALCCGCEACAEACPRKCILLKPDEEGFLYPTIEVSSCIDCGICETVCPELNIDDSVRVGRPKMYSAVSFSDDLMRSSSGAMFPLFARNVLEQKGVIFGAAFDDEWNVHHIAVDSPDDLHLLQGSKYVQSSTDGCYASVRDYLESGRTVLYSGTACQINGLHCYLRKDYSNLLTIDVICHGVPSPQLWVHYLTGFEHDYGSSSVSVSFRDKSISWEDFSMRINFADGQKYEMVHRKDPYMRLFLSNASLRPSCYQCVFKNGCCRSDITLGDAWGIKEVEPDMFNENGVSVVIVNTPKGEAWLERVSSYSSYMKESNEHLLDKNQLYYRPVASHPKRDKVMLGLRSGKSVDSLVHYIEIPLWRRVARKVKRLFV